MANLWLTKPLSAADKQRARTVASVAQVTVGENLGMRIELLAHALASVMHHGDRSDPEAALLTILRRVLDRSVEIAREDEPRATAALHALTNSR